MEKIQIQSTKELEAWLAKNHKQKDSILVVTYKKHIEDKYVSRFEVLDVLLCYGWVDGRLFKVDQDRVSQLISPRNPDIPWAKWYRDKAEKLINQGRMQPPGLRLIQIAKKNSLWSESKIFEEFQMPEDLERALRESRVLSRFKRLSPAYKRNLLRWIEKAVASRTRAQRIGKIVKATLEQVKIPNM